MSELANIPDRVTRLEHEMADVRFLATKAEKDAADSTTVVHGHIGVIDAIRDDQVEQGKKIAVIDSKIDRVEGEMRGGFALLAQGQRQITDLLTQHINECEQGGDADE